VILSPLAFLRVGLLLFLGVILQLSVASQIGIGGGYLDLVPLVVAAIAIYAGSTTGAGAGFAMGVLLDLASGQVMGISSLVLTSVGYAVGRFREVRDPAHGLMPIPVGAAATLGWVTAFAAVSFMLDVGATVSPLVIRDMLLTTLIGAVAAIPVFAACRRVLRPSLAVDPLDSRRRRRAPRDTGPLGLRGMEV
jgi:rod shape-determining protein MreD